MGGDRWLMVACCVGCYDNNETNFGDHRQKGQKDTEKNTAG